jgi:hypothetical protein
MRSNYIWKYASANSYRLIQLSVFSADFKVGSDHTVGAILEAALSHLPPKKQLAVLKALPRQPGNRYQCAVGPITIVLP